MNAGTWDATADFGDTSPRASACLRSGWIRSARRGGGQAIVEFGIIALLFTLLVFATIDFGLLLNTWITVSSASREIARSASVGKHQIFLKDEASKLNLPSVSVGGFAGGPCCGPTSALEVKVEYFNHTACGAAIPAGCPVPGSKVYDLFPFPNVDSPGTCSPAASCRPQTDDWVTVTVVAHGAQVITPLVRPFFGCSNGSNPSCFVPLSSSTTMRYEGAEF